MNLQTSPIAAIQELANVLHQAKVTMALNAQMARRLKQTGPDGRPNQVDVAPLSDLLALLLEQFESAETMAAHLEILLHELGLQDPQTETTATFG